MLSIEFGWCGVSSSKTVVPPIGFPFILFSLASSVSRDRNPPISCLASMSQILFKTPHSKLLPKFVDDLRHGTQNRKSVTRDRWRTWSHNASTKYPHPVSGRPSPIEPQEILALRLLDASLLSFAETLTRSALKTALDRERGQDQNEHIDDRPDEGDPCRHLKESRIVDDGKSVCRREKANICQHQQGSPNTA